MGRRLNQIATAVRLGGSGVFVAGAGVVALAILVVAIIAFVSWLKHDPKEQAEAARRAALAHEPPPKAPEAAVNVAREVFTYMIERKFAEALPMTDGQAAELVQTELRQQLATVGRDPELAQILNSGMAAKLLSFETVKVEVTNGGETVTLRCRSLVAFIDGRRSVTPLIRLRWAFDHWAVYELNPNAPDESGVKL
ncbi:MAG TPA: hypothetical protein VGQ83_01435 [Polyangia bacterium]